MLLRSNADIGADAFVNGNVIWRRARQRNAARAAAARRSTARRRIRHARRRAVTVTVAPRATAAPASSTSRARSRRRPHQRRRRHRPRARPRWRRSPRRRASPSPAAASTLDRHRRRRAPSRWSCAGHTLLAIGGDVTVARRPRRPARSVRGAGPAGRRTADRQRRRHLRRRRAARRASASGSPARRPSSSTARPTVSGVIHAPVGAGDRLQRAPPLRAACSRRSHLDRRRLGRCTSTAPSLAGRHGRAAQPAAADRPLTA